MRTRAILVVGGLVAVLAVGIHGQTPQTEAGRKVYEREKCTMCHQIEKRGNSRYPLDGVASRLTADQIRRWLTHPAEMEARLQRMPAVRMSTMQRRLNAQDLDALVAYLRTLK